MEGLTILYPPQHANLEDLPVIVLDKIEGLLSYNAKMALRVSSRKLRTYIDSSRGLYQGLTILEEGVLEEEAGTDRLNKKICLIGLDDHKLHKRQPGRYLFNLRNLLEC